MESICNLKFVSRHSTEVAVISFGLGTTMFFLYELFPNECYILILGMVYVFIAGILHLLLFGNLLYYFIKLRDQREYIAIKMLILVSNIPIAFIYYRFVISTFNQTNSF